MLTAEIKKKIDYLRDVLVGKIPVPSQQIEQITLGLIYKFMSDIDEQNEELGGKSFFSGEYKKYAWKNIMDRSLAGHERVLFYAEGLERMGRNKEIPQLFRDIFKGAFLPFKDPAVLDLFLKGINEFNYDNSEELGNAFEYLLSTAGSQGDAGQFRTPRHIIDFIVSVVDPQKEDKILDPACGTAGFLISAYKHILKNNTDTKTNKAGSLLTATERKKLTKNIVGYDISQEMVRLSLVNLYLHGFAEPNIYEYDTLSSLEKWDDAYDCILANPPFMTPRGGIKPHNRFSIQANKSEVLFVDYITEHLTPSGKAGVIVPEGIIFQGGNAYKQLRKMLVEDGLWAVVSLPQGVFSPYSLVKTSILFFNSTVAKQTKDILFVKVENDGFDLGAQRRPFDKNDLPKALEIIEKYKKAIQANKNFNLDKDEEKFASVVSKEKIAENGEYNLSANRYLLATDYSNAKYEMVELGEVVVDMKDGGTPSRSKNEYFGGNINWAVVKDIKPEIYDTKEKLTEEGLKNSSAKIWDIDTIIISLGATIGNVGIAKVPLATKQGLSGIVVDRNKILPKYLYYILLDRKDYIQSLATGASIKEVRPSKLKQLLKIPLPPIEIQKQIIEELDKKQQIVDSAKELISKVERERANSGQIFEGLKCNWVKLGDIADKITKGTTPTTNGYKFEKEGVNFIKVESISENGKVDFNKLSFISSECHNALNRSQLKVNDILFSIAGTKMGISAIVTKDILPANTNQALAIISLKDNVDADYVLTYLRSTSIKEQIENIKVGVAQFNLSLLQVSELKIPLPPIEIQKQIAIKTKVEQEIIEANKKLIEIYEQKIKNRISTLWGE